MKVFKRVGEVYHEVGFWMTFVRALKKISRYIFTTNSAYWLERDLDEPIPDIDPIIPVKLTLFSKDETITWFKQQKESWIYNPPEIACGLKEGHYFPNLKHEGRESLVMQKLALVRSILTITSRKFKWHHILQFVMTITFYRNISVGVVR